MYIPLEQDNIAKTLKDTHEESMQALRQFYDGFRNVNNEQQKKQADQMKKYVDEGIPVSPHKQNPVNKLNERYLRFQQKFRSVQENIMKQVRALTKKDFIKKIWNAFKSVAKTIGQIAQRVYGNWFTKLLYMLLFLSVFDPKGKFLKSILGFITKMALQLLEVILEKLPAVIKAFIHIITEVLPDAFRKVVDMVFDFAHKRLVKLIEEIESPFLKWLVTQLSDLFSPSGTFATFLKDSAGILIPLFILVGLLVKAAPFLAMIGKVFLVIFTALKFVLMKVIVPVIMSIIGFFGLIPVLVAVAFMAVGFLIYKYWEEIKSFFISVADNVIGVVMGIINYIWNAIKSVGKWISSGFTMFVDIIKNIPEYLGDAWDAILNWVISLGRVLLDFIRRMLSTIFAPIRSAMNIIRPIINTMKEVFEPLKPVLQAISRVLSVIWNLIKNTILKAINGVVSAFETIGDFFAMFSQLGMSAFVGDGAGGRRQEFLRFREEARASGVDLGKVKDALDDGVDEVVAKRTLNEREMDLFKNFKEKGGYEKGVKHLAGNSTATNTMIQRLKGIEINSSTN